MLGRHSGAPIPLDIGASRGIWPTKRPRWAKVERGLRVDRRWTSPDKGLNRSPRQEGCWPLLGAQSKRWVSAGSDRCSSSAAGVSEVAAETPAQTWEAVAPAFYVSVGLAAADRCARERRIRARPGVLGSLSAVSEFYVGAFEETDFVCLGVLADGDGEGFTDRGDTGANGGRGLYFACDQFF